jgi:hypothetical protein
MEMFFEAEIKARHAQLVKAAARSRPLATRLRSRLAAFVAGFQRPEIAPCAGLTTC